MGGELSDFDYNRLVRHAEDIHDNPTGLINTKLVGLNTERDYRAALEEVVRRNQQRRKDTPDLPVLGISVHDDIREYDDSRGRAVRTVREQRSISLTRTVSIAGEKHTVDLHREDFDAKGEVVGSVAGIARQREPDKQSYSKDIEHVQIDAVTHPKKRR